MKKLVLKAQQENDAEAFILLMEQNRQSMLKTAKAYLHNEEDVADVMQETILTCYEKLNTLKNPQFFKTWLIRILINKCKDRLRQNKELPLSEEMFQTAYEETTSASDREFTELIQSLEEKYRIVIVLYYAEGYNTREIAKLLGVNVATVKSRLLRARNKLAEEYEKEAGSVYG